jgi:hypothetical protein
MSSLLTDTASVGEFQLIHASGISKQAWHIPGAVCTVLSSWWWAEKPPETCRTLAVIKNIVYRCILLVILKYYINKCTVTCTSKILRFCCMLSFGWYPGVWSFYSHLSAYEDRTDRVFRNVGI